MGEQCSRMKPLVFIIILYVCFMDIVCNNKIYLIETRDKHNISSKENNLENISEKDYSDDGKNKLVKKRRLFKKLCVNAKNSKYSPSNKLCIKWREKCLLKKWRSHEFCKKIEQAGVNEGNAEIFHKQGK